MLTRIFLFKSCDTDQFAVLTRVATRDQITGDLAKGDAAALPEIRSSNLEQTAKH